MASDIPYGALNLKTYAIRFLISILAIFYAIKKILEKNQSQVSNNFILKSYLVFIASMILSALIGVDPYHSFFSDTHRMGGIISFLNLFALFVILSDFFKQKIRFENLMFVFQIVSIILFIYSFLQMAGFFPTSYQNRFESLMGNPNFYGNYSAVIFLITIYFLVITPKNKIFKKKYFFYFVSIVNLVAVFITQNRSAFLGIAAAYFFIIAFNYLRKQYEVNFVLLRKSAIILTAAMIVVFLLHKTGFFIIENRVFSEGRRTVDEISTGRKSIWIQAIGAITERPFFGWGVENFAYTTKYAPVELSFSPWQDRVHNIFLEILVYNGLIGFFVFIYFLIQIGKGVNLLQKKSRSDHLEMLFIMYFIYYIVNGAFTFDDQIAAILFTVLLAYLASSINIKKKSKPTVAVAYFKIASSSY